MDFIPELDGFLSVNDKVKLLEQAGQQIWDSIDDPAEEGRDRSGFIEEVLRTGEVVYSRGT